MGISVRRRAAAWAALAGLAGLLVFPAAAAATISGGCAATGTAASSGSIDLTTETEWHVSSSDVLSATGSSPVVMRTGSVSAYALGIAIPIRSGSGNGDTTGSIDGVSMDAFSTLGKVFVMAGAASGDGECDGQILVVVDDVDALFTLLGGGGLVVGDPWPRRGLPGLALERLPAEGPGDAVRRARRRRPRAVARAVPGHQPDELRSASPSSWSARCWDSPSPAGFAFGGPDLEPPGPSSPPPSPTEPGVTVTTERPADRAGSDRAGGRRGMPRGSSTTLVGPAAGDVPRSPSPPRNGPMNDGASHPADRLTGPTTSRYGGGSPGRPDADTRCRGLDPAPQSRSARPRARPATLPGAPQRGVPSRLLAV